MLRAAAAAFAVLSTALPTAGAERLRPKDIHALPVSAPSVVQNYGSDPLQYGELRLPAGKGPFPVAVVIHGGCWTKGFDTLKGTAPIASALAGKGIATWNIEYRQVGDAGGGWPGSFQDWGAATDHLRVLARFHPLDLERVVTVGHSAGGHGALWIAARPRLPAGSEVRGKRPLKVAAAVAIDGPADVHTFAGRDERVCGQRNVAGFFGSAVAERPERYGLGNPAELIPLGARQYLVASDLLKPVDAYRYRDMARANGDVVEVLELRGAGHFNMLAPGDPAWTELEALIVQRAFAPAR